MEQVTRYDIDKDFEILGELLKTHPVKTSLGAERYAGPEEFMYMHKTPEGVRGFKHICTRNYVFLIPEADKFDLYVPVDQGAFMQGTFDKF